MTAPTARMGKGAVRRITAPAARLALPELGEEASPVKVGGGVPDLRRRLVLLEATALAVAWGATLTLTRPSGSGLQGLPLVAVETLVLTLAGLAMAALMHLYRSRVSALRSVTLERQALLVVALAGAAHLVARLGGANPTMTPAVVGGAVCFVLLASVRSGFDAWVGLLRRDGALARPVVLVGSMTESTTVADLLASHPEIGYRPVGFVSDDGPPEEPIPGLPWIGPLKVAAAAVSLHRATGALIAANSVPSVELNQVIRQLHAAGVHVHLSSGLERIANRRIRHLPMAHEPFFYLEAARFSPWALGVKRGIDMVGATVILVLTAPIMLVAAIMVRCSGKGPIIFHQVRIGRDGERVVIRKFRTMTVDAEAQLEELQSANERVGPLFKVAADPRVTRVGKWLRASSVDELPQLFDVIGGSLSLVGPRPALPEEVAQFDEELLARLRMRPGVTGLWQVEARHNSSFYAYRHLDLFYVENWRLALDVMILLATVRTVIGDTFRAVRRSKRYAQLTRWAR
jgi:exopolysaccharide biosynthesis polyprenyl glycosylphosphotransferase